ncbi:OmpH family outer membrane protein [Rubellimicrobium aerolatum]|uniref:OmpH family outer membrane protein n=1 Tax=Rubellimicrobium aerolatum TaxID=490979 RepID=A0ABW0S8F0_9RHOB|nr:OmpH family outer membrane protein [Rubellimicrobium aerolatum]MBP1804254.1 Skp family chaperone for outer membrane proteins [Rubellimicrobium aerolatum]
MRGRALIAAALLTLAPLGAGAQEGFALGQVQSPVLTIVAERLLAETRYGRRLAADLRLRSEALAAENERLAAQLTAEERALTERRPAMEIEAFRAEAEAFDARVQSIRAAQDAKEAELQDAATRSRSVFLDTVKPVLDRLMIDSGAAVILERRDVFLSVGLVDVTDAAITAIDEQIGDGTGRPEAAPVQDPAPMAEEAAPPGGG